MDQEIESVPSGSVLDSLDDRVVPDEQQAQPNALQMQDEPDHGPKKIYIMPTTRVNKLV